MAGKGRDFGSNFGWERGEAGSKPTRRDINEAQAAVASLIVMGMLVLTLAWIVVSEAAKH